MSEPAANTSVGNVEDLSTYGRTASADLHRVVREMAGPDDELRPFVRQFASYADVPVARVRDILRELDAAGLVTHGPVVDTDTGQPCGSTWWLTERGAELQRILGK